MRHMPDTQRGAALLIAILVVTLATIAAAAMATRQQFDLRRTDNIIQSDQTYLYALAAESWVLSMLEEDLKKNNNFDDYEETEQRKQGLSVPVDGGTLSGSILDLHSRFNLNNLVTINEEKKWVKSEEDIRIFRRFIQFLNQNPPETVDKEGKVTLPETDIPENVVFKILDWMDSDIDPYMGDDGEGAEDGIYTMLPNPYVTPNNPMASVTELLLIDSVWTEEEKMAIYERLLPYVAVLPERTKININVAPPQLIAALGESFDFSDAESLSNDAQNSPYKKADEFIKKYLADYPEKTDVEKEKKAELEKSLKERVTAASTYFLLNVSAEIYNGRAKLTSMVRRSDKAQMQVIARGQGGI